MKPEALLIHRKEFLTTVIGCKRDAVRDEMAKHYSRDKGTMSRSFVVSVLNDCCAASKGLADGLAFVTWARARADLHKDGPRRAERKARKKERDSEARRQIGMYIRELLEGAEGSKGGSRGSGKVFVPKQSMKQRYEAYRKYRIVHRLPVVGCLSTFINCWKAHDEVVNQRVTGHAICDECTKIGVLKARYTYRTDEAARLEMQAIRMREDIHTREHRGERQYADDTWNKAQTRPYQYTMLNMDAPTRDQLDIPVQARKYGDVAKGLEEAPSWASKMMGVMMAGDVELAI